MILRPVIKNGRFQLNEKPLEPIGFNYWPSESGVECWRKFNIKEWEKDFSEIRDKGYNAVRIFCHWPDFQPREDFIDLSKIDDFRRAILAAQSFGLWTIPTIFQGFMSGINLDPLWRQGRNHIRDISLREAMKRLLCSICENIKDLSNLLALDLANEIDVICPDVDGISVKQWTSELRSVVQETIPGLLVTNGTADSLIHATSKWSYADQELDFHCMHGYPMFWIPLPFSSLKAARSSLVFGGMTAFARADGPVMREEYGTAIGGDSDIIRGFVRASSFSSYLAGANGFLYWCWRDLSTKQYPYEKEPFESSMGYLNADFSSKLWSEGLDDFKEFLKQHEGWKPVSSDVGIYIPKQYNSFGKDADYAMALAYENLVANGLNPQFTRFLDSHFNLIVIPVTELGISEIEALAKFCSGGGNVLAFGIGSKTCGAYWESLTKLEQIDIWRPLEPVTVVLEQHKFVCMPSSVGLPWPVLSTKDGHSTIWLQNDQTVLGTQTRLSHGSITTFIPPLASLKTVDINASCVWLFAEMLNRIDYLTPYSGFPPSVQVGQISNNNGAQKLIAINHSSEEISFCININNTEIPLALLPKGVEVVNLF